MLPHILANCFRYTLHLPQCHTMTYQKNPYRHLLVARLLKEYKSHSMSV